MEQGFVAVGARVVDRSRRAAVQPRRLRCSVPRMSAGSGTSEVVEGPFKGVYGQWYLTKDDVEGVNQYRLGLMGSALAAAAGVVYATGPAEPSPLVLDSLFLMSNASLGYSLWKIHIYMKPMHNALKVLWGAGTAGVVATMLLSGSGAVVGSYENTLWMLASGWPFVALTGLFIKEAVCFNRQEAWGLAALVPIVCMGHFTHLLPDGVERGGVSLFAALYVFFAARKFQQPPTDDLGDKSVFDHYDELAKQAAQ